MATLKVSDLGDYIREQRRSAQISLRQLARLAGVSNPYLSQIERGLRKPSAEILQQIAKALRISAEALYVQAGILEDRGADTNVPAAILSDVTISERQKQVLLEIYESFRTENAGRVEGEPAVVPPVAVTVPATAPAPRKTAAKKTAGARKTAAAATPRRRTTKSTTPAAGGEADAGR
jgi:transcriptional regulator with XRE-family HTH domain